MREMRGQGHYFSLWTPHFLLHLLTPLGSKLILDTFRLFLNMSKHNFKRIKQKWLPTIVSCPNLIYIINLYACLHLCKQCTKLVILHANLAEVVKTHCIIGGQVTSKGLTNLTVHPINLINMVKITTRLRKVGTLWTPYFTMSWYLGVHTKCQTPTTIPSRKVDSRQNDRKTDRRREVLLEMMAT